jgi:hypothetical protein
MHIDLLSNNYSLRPIILFANTDISNTKIYLDTSILAKSNMGWREYHSYAQVDIVSQELVPGSKRKQQP